MDELDEDRRNRAIKSRAHGGAVQLADCLASLFALELACPSRDLYIISPWISDMTVLPNSGGQFRAVLPEMGSLDVGLATVLNELTERGSVVRVLYRADEERTHSFLRKLAASVEVRARPGLHEKGIVADSFYLRGSMNFTYSGVHLNDESVELTTDTAEVTRARVEAIALWEGHMS